MTASPLTGSLSLPEPLFSYPARGNGVIRRSCPGVP
jgi:hypothetical protein